MRPAALDPPVLLKSFKRLKGILKEFLCCLGFFQDYFVIDKRGSEANGGHDEGSGLEASVSYFYMKTGLLIKTLHLISNSTERTT